MPPAPSSLPEPAVAALLAERAAFKRFLRRRVASDAEAEDLLQDALLRALRRGGRLRRDERAVAWFYRILRRVLIDHYRAQAARRRRHEALARELDAENAAAPPPDWDAAVCRCFLGLLPALPPRAAELIRRLDLNGETPAAVARRLGLSPNALAAAHHRARRTLRRRLEVFCGACSRDACLRCACPPGKLPQPRKKS